MLQTRVGERIQRGDQVMWLGVGDLAHVGPRFGDMEPVSDDDRDSLERRDQQTLVPVLSGDAPSFFGEIRRERESPPHPPAWERSTPSYAPAAPRPAASAATPSAALAPAPTSPPPASSTRSWRWETYCGPC
jgi:hypothetical protein